MKHPDKWRETVDIYSLPFKELRILEILGYPHAGNDVFYASILFWNEKLNAFIKVERQLGADISNEISIIPQMPCSFAPEVLEYSLSEPRYIVTKEVVGERLSTIAKEISKKDTERFLSMQAACLSEIHKLNIECENVKDRKFFHKPSLEYCQKFGLDDIYSFLTTESPLSEKKCFVHGDFHYANILWNDNKLACVLDYELSGYGIREFDMAWAIFLRPSQSFADSWESVNAFLSGYLNEYYLDNFCYYFIQIAAHFYQFGDEEYRTKVKNLVNSAISTYRTHCSSLHTK